MTGFIIRRLGQAVIVILGVTIITFALERAIPGNLAREILGNRASPQAMAQFDRQNGLNTPLYHQYWLFLDKLLHGNLGYSFLKNRSVDSLLSSELPRDAVLGGLSLLFAVIIAVPLGVAQAVRRNGLIDYTGTGTSFLLYSMPTYAVGLILIQIFSDSLRVGGHSFLPPEAPQGASALSMLAHPSGLILPVATLTLVTFALFSRYMRSSAIDTLAQDYMRTARAKGLPERLVLWRHLLRNSMITVVTLIGVSIPTILTGTLIVEQVFNFDGAGLEYYTAAQSNDYPVVLGITVLVGVITVLGNLVADIGYAVLDPRIRY